MNASQTTRRSYKPFVLVALAGILLVAALVWYILPKGTSGGDAIAIRMSELAYEANGALENEAFAVGKDDSGKLRFGIPEAISRYEEILRLMPDEELPYRNLAIARLIANRSAKQSTEESTTEANQLIIDSEQAREDLVTAVEEYLNRFESPVAKYLHGEILRDLGTGTNQDIEKVEKFFAAAQADPDHIPFWYLAAAESYQLLIGTALTERESMLKINRKALEELRRLCPENLWVIRQSLMSMIQQQDPNSLAYWKQVRPILEKAGFSSQNYAGDDPSYRGDYSQEFERLEKAFENQAWPTADQIIFGLDNSMKGKLPAVSDLGALQPNPLDYLLWTFSEEVTAATNRELKAEQAGTPIRFELASLPTEINASRVLDFALADVDFDGILELFVLRSEAIEVYRGPIGSGEGQPILTIPISGSYSIIKAGFLLTVAENGTGIRRRVSDAAGRESGKTKDELPQILIAGDDGLAVFSVTWNKEDGFSFQAEPQPDTLSQVTKIRKVVIVDFDQDADLDAVVVSDGQLKLLMNRGNNTFIDSSQWLYVPADFGPLVDVQIVDWNRDLYIDLLVQAADGKLGLLDNEHHGAFRYRQFNAPQGTTLAGFAVGELDGNASWDLVANVGSNTVAQFTETKAWSRVQWLATAPGLNASVGAWQVEGEILGPWQLGDFDNSTTQDLLLWKDGQLHFHPTTWRGTSLAQGAERIGPQAASSSVQLSAKPDQGERGDFDNDGDLDVLVLVEGKLGFLRNDGGNQNPWLAIVPLGYGDNASRTNHLGIGSLMEARIGPHYFAETVTRPAVHVGLGAYDRPNLARIIWTNGVPQNLLLPPGRQTVEMLCILKGSCPFIYTWDGDEWQFLSDCLWAAPIGLQSAGGGLVPTRNWEYLRLGPNVLKPTDGTYRVLLTEELWEVAYFDHVRLLAVDHPADVEVHINDKVGPPEIVQHRLYRVAEKIPPTKATNQNDEDLLTDLLNLDDRFVKSFTKRLTQGYVEPHDLILEFGGTDISNKTLFLTGWIQPTDTSINVMLKQNPDWSGPQFPALYVIGEDGQWQAVSRPMGFPGGKTKTMAVPLTGLFPTADQRIKITSSAEIYWDQAYVADDAAEHELHQHEAQLVSANSFYRGTSRRQPLGQNGPENFDAKDIATESVWPPVQGGMSPHGLVTELLNAQDNRLVVLGTGDAVELRFSVPEATIPPGYRRTFLFYSVGYDKDSDLHTLEGQRIGPMPTNEMVAYPDYAAGGTTNDPAYPRQQNWYRFWRQIQNPQIEASPEDTKIPRGEYRR
ncbi:MAG: VCBS repeat-containing protein [Planctomycetaceae bacterium]|nr:VCBS repeat-containing protein [Planctomycetaceae bacterium]